MHICLTALHYGKLTGSEIYLYELMKELLVRGHKVTVVSKFDGPLVDALPVTKLTLKELHEAKKKPKFDILHLNHVEPSTILLKLIPNTPAVMTVHSELMPSFEAPITDIAVKDRVKHYIAIRQGILDMMVLSYGVPKKDISLIYNGFDTTRFKKLPLPEEKNILFVGRFDGLRKNTIFDLITDAHRDKTQLTLVGEGFEQFKDKLDESLITVHGATDDLEPFMAKASHTAGIMLGRTTIEGWLCGRPGFVFTVDGHGNIVTKKLEEPPEDLSEFDIKVMTDKVESVYRRVLLDKSR